MDAHEGAGGGSRDHLNLGTFALREKPAQPGAKPQPMTLIVTGVGRSGTSMAAKVLDALGVPMGSVADLAVHEDKEFLQALLYFDFQLLHKLIQSRNAEHERWGFKFPSLQNHMLPPQLQKFRNPHLIVIMRDPVAIASRSFASDEQKMSVNETLQNVTRQISDMISLVERAECPVLLLSYEKFVAFPENAIKSIIAFCRLHPDEGQMARAMGAVAPNNSNYIELFHRKFRGHFDAVIEGHAVGWCAATDGNGAVTVELLADDEVVASAAASLFRKDLLVAGIGQGVHAFRISTSGLNLGAEAVLAVRPVGTAMKLDGSGRRLRELVR